MYGKQWWGKGFEITMVGGTITLYLSPNTFRTSPLPDLKKSEECHLEVRSGRRGWAKHMLNKTKQQKVEYKYAVSALLSLQHHLHEIDIVRSLHPTCLILVYENMSLRRTEAQHFAVVQGCVCRQQLMSEKLLFSLRMPSVQFQ